MVETPAELLTRAAARHADIQRSIKEHAAELAKTIGAQRVEEGQSDGGGNSGQ